jgi:hypothetical protein
VLIVSRWLAGYAAVLQVAAVSLMGVAAAPAVIALHVSSGLLLAVFVWRNRTALRRRLHRAERRASAQAVTPETEQRRVIIPDQYAPERRPMPLPFERDGV